ncbi:UDP-glycosyltransferase 76C4-like [Pyrus ussuriensis x Pyrus communis]|uniref:UDP-glycosyltransferase 76C4-like n=1 Tax=Pyrus ussuriensis x Pyrus communis TaxID=2448454 RepID=A0A5N5GMK6_9ROSA|nr:UDP-glycosyltransferase 76C4-like [Pyrus ussuriensis x Pyrus communis]
MRGTYEGRELREVVQIDAMKMARMGRVIDSTSSWESLGDDLREGVWVVARIIHSDGVLPWVKGLRLILFPMPLQGHINPMLELANVLHHKGFSITIIHTQFNSLNPTTHPHFIFHSIPVELSRTEASTNDGMAFILLLNVKCFEPFSECLPRLLSDDDQEPVACLISDLLFSFTQHVAENLKLPRILLRTSAASSFVAYAAFPLLLEKGYLPIQESQLEEPVLELPPFKVKDLPVLKTKDPQKYYEVVSGLKKAVEASCGIIFNTFEDLEGNSLATIRQEFNTPIFPIGPLHKCYPANTSSSINLLSQDQKTLFLEIAWGLANRNQRFLWVVRPRLVHGSEWIEPLPSGFFETLNGRGQILKWASQKKVLAHQVVGVFWTYNGWNSKLESICEGVPMICMPCLSDQMANARYVSHVWKVGLQLEHGVDRGEIERTIRKIMAEKEGEEIRDRILMLMEKEKICIKQGGSSYQSLDGFIKYILSQFAIQSQGQ